MNDLLSFYVQRYFMSYLMKQHNYGSNTIASYRDTFRLLLLFMEQLGYQIATLKISDIDNERVAAFMEWLVSNRANSASTKNVRLAHLKSFFRYLMMNAPEFSEQCRKVLGIPFSKTTKQPPQCLSTGAIEQLLHSVDATTDEGLRHLAILALLYDSGCRVQELMDLNVSDFQSGTCCRIYVHGKGDKFRSIPIMPETGKIISKYIKRFKLPADSGLFINPNGNRLTRQGVRYIVKKYSELVNLASPNTIYGNVYPHRLRHSKATHLVTQGVNIYNVRDFLGHESVTTTQVYLTSNPEVTRKAIEKASAKTVYESLNYYSEEQKADLLVFLKTLG